jgi:hypothetical protein
MTDHDADTQSQQPEPVDTDDDGDGDADPEVPPAVVDEAERLTRLARDAIDENETDLYREKRDEIVSEHDFEARVREEGSRDTLVLYPAEWIEDGLIQRDRIEDVDRGIERPLDAPGAADDWEEVESHNRAIVARVADEHGDTHAANVAAFADFMGNHHARAIDDATDADVEEFLTEYYPRNAWPTGDERDAVEESLALAFEAADVSGPD